MDYNSIDEDDVDNLRLAALMTLKKKSYLPINTAGSNTSEKYFPNIFAHSSSRGSSYNTRVKNNRGWFTSSNKLSSKRGSFKKSVYPNSNLIAIVPSNSESDFHSDLSNSTLTLTSEDKKSSNNHSLNNQVSTKFSRLEHESDSEESEDSEPEINKREESDDCDILSLGEKDKDLDDLEQLMDIMEAEINNDESSIKNSSNLKINNDLIVKNADELNANRNELIPLNQPKIIEDSKSQLHPLKEELESINTLETNTNIPSQCTLLKSCVVLRSPMPSNIKRSISPYTKYLNRCSTTAGHSILQRRSLSPKKLSPIKEKILSPILCSPPISQNHSSSPKKNNSFSSQDILSNNKIQLSPLSRKSRSTLKRKSKSRSSNKSPANDRSYSPTKKLMRSRLISPTIQCVDTNDHLQKTIQVEPSMGCKQTEMRPFDPVLEVVDIKKLSLQHTDLRTEIKRRRALRLNMNQWHVKKKSESFYPTRLLQSAIKDVVDSSANEVKRKKCSYKPEIRVQTEGDSNGRRVILLSENQYNANDELESYASAKRLKGNQKNVPLNFKVTGVCKSNMKQNGLKKITRQNINVTDIDQM